MSGGNTAKDGTGTIYWLLVDSEGRQITVGPAAHDAAAVGAPVRIGGVYRSTVPAVSANDIVDALMDAAGRLMVRNDVNQEVTVLASAARTATTNSADLTNYGARGVMLTLDATAIAATPSIILSITAKDPVSGKYETLFDAAAAVTAVGTHTYLLYPGGTAANDVVEVGDMVLPRTWRVTVTHGDADSITYSVSGCYIP